MSHREWAILAILGYLGTIFVSVALLSGIHRAEIEQQGEEVPSVTRTFMDTLGNITVGSATDLSASIARLLFRATKATIGTKDTGND